MIFRSNPGTEQAFKTSRIFHFIFSNNHTPDFGEKGLKDTFNYLEGANIKYVGAGKMNKKHIKLFILRKGK